MASVIYSTVPSDLDDWQFNDGASNVLANTSDLFYPYPLYGGVTAKYLNKCVDGVTGQWVFWQTDYEDLYGNEYPGDSFNAATYKIQTIVYSRQQL